MTPRDAYIQRIAKALSRYPITMLTGPRQVGKGTMVSVTWDVVGW